MTRTVTIFKAGSDIAAVKARIDAQAQSVIDGNILVSDWNDPEVVESLATQIVYSATQFPTPIAAEIESITADAGFGAFTAVERSDEYWEGQAADAARREQEREAADQTKRAADLYRDHQSWLAIWSPRNQSASQLATRLGQAFNGTTTDTTGLLANMDGRLYTDSNSPNVLLLHYRSPEAAQAQIKNAIKLAFDAYRLELPPTPIDLASIASKVKGRVYPNRLGPAIEAVIKDRLLAVGRKVVDEASNAAVLALAKAKEIVIQAGGPDEILQTFGMRYDDVVRTPEESQTWAEYELARQAFNRMRDIGILLQGEGGQWPYQMTGYPTLRPYPKLIGIANAMARAIVEDQELMGSAPDIIRGDRDLSTYVYHWPELATLITKIESQLLATFVPWWNIETARTFFAEYKFPGIVVEPGMIVDLPTEWDKSGNATKFERAKAGDVISNPVETINGPIIIYPWDNGIPGELYPFPQIGMTGFFKKLGRALTKPFKEIGRFLGKITAELKRAADKIREALPGPLASIATWMGSFVLSTLPGSQLYAPGAGTAFAGTGINLGDRIGKVASGQDANFLDDAAKAELLGSLANDLAGLAIAAAIVAPIAAAGAAPGAGAGSGGIAALAGKGAAIGTAAAGAAATKAAKKGSQNSVGVDGEPDTSRSSSGLLIAAAGVGLVALLLGGR